MTTYNAIFTRYLGPTNTRGSRIKATARGLSVTIPLDHALDLTERHEKAARALLGKLGWYDRDTALAGETPDGRGYVFVAITPERG